MKKRKIIKKLISLSERQVKYIEMESEKYGICNSEMIKRMLDKIIEQYEKDNNIKFEN